MVGISYVSDDTTSKWKFAGAPRSADGVGLFDASAKTLWLRTDWSSLLPATNGLVVFAPNNVDGVGLFDASARTFELHDIHDQRTGKFAGAAVAPNGQVVFAPRNADVVFVLEIILH